MIQCLDRGTNHQFAWIEVFQPCLLIQGYPVGERRASLGDFYYVYFWVVGVWEVGVGWGLDGLK